MDDLSSVMEMVGAVGLGDAQLCNTRGVGVWVCRGDFGPATRMRPYTPCSYHALLLQVKGGQTVQQAIAVKKKKAGIKG